MWRQISKVLTIIFSSITYTLVSFLFIICLLFQFHHPVRCTRSIIEPIFWLCFIFLKRHFWIRQFVIARVNSLLCLWYLVSNPGCCQKCSFVFLSFLKKTNKLKATLVSNNRGLLHKVTWIPACKPSAYAQGSLTVTYQRLLSGAIAKSAKQCTRKCTMSLRRKAMDLSRAQ